MNIFVLTRPINRDLSHEERVRTGLTSEESFAIASEYTLSAQDVKDLESAGWSISCPKVAEPTSLYQVSGLIKELCT